jgi:DNA topoisomerase I
MSRTATAAEDLALLVTGGTISTADRESHGFDGCSPRVPTVEMARRGGWRRLGTRRFRYVDSRGRPITEEEALERIRGLAIPPAWTDVWVSPNAGAKLQATGLDTAGRRQYLYHPRYRAAREREKFERLLDFAARLPAFRARASSDLRRGPYEQEWACALAIGLINNAWIRVGSDRHARASRTYGVTTLTKRHVSVDGESVELCFRGKNSKLTRRTVRSRPLARGLGELLVLPGARLFRYERDGELANLTAPTLNAYIAEHLGNGFTAKDFRTWGGTLVAATELARRGALDDDAEATRTLAAVMRKVADELGNTPAVARASYVSPLVVERYRAGRTIDDFRTRSRRARLTADEHALLRMLRSRP